MSKPINKNHDAAAEIILTCLMVRYVQQEAFRISMRKMMSHSFKSGGIVAGEVHQGEAIINRKGGVYCPPPTFSAQPKCKNILTKSQSDALDILKNINQLKK